MYVTYPVYFIECQTILHVHITNLEKRLETLQESSLGLFKTACLCSTEKLYEKQDIIIGIS